MTRKVKAKHRIITPQCKLRPRDAIIAEVLESVKESLNNILDSPGTVDASIHIIVEVEYPDVQDNQSG